MIFEENLFVSSIGTLVSSERRCVSYLILKVSFLKYFDYSRCCSPNFSVEDQCSGVDLSYVSRFSVEDKWSGVQCQSDIFTQMVQVRV